MKAAGILMMISGVVVGIYVGVWVCFIGGIIGAIQAFGAEVLVAMDVAINLFKVVCAAGIGSLCAWFLVIPGALIYNSDRP